LLGDFYPEVGAGVIPPHGKAGMALPIVVLLEERAERKARGIFEGLPEVSGQSYAIGLILEVGS
jgi:hypothetical protein